MIQVKNKGKDVSMKDSWNARRQLLSNQIFLFTSFVLTVKQLLSPICLAKLRQNEVLTSPRSFGAFYRWFSSKYRHMTEWVLFSERVFALLSILEMMPMSGYSFLRSLQVKLVPEGSLTMHLKALMLSEGETHMFVDELKILIVLFGFETLPIHSIAFDLFQLFEFRHEKWFSDIATIMSINKLSTSNIFHLILMN